MRQNIIETAISKLGIKEDPPGSNHQEFGEWFGLNNAEWCAIFCSYCYAFGGHPLGNVGWLKGFASVPMGMEHWKNQITKDPQPADLVLFDWNKDGSPDHVGMFLGWIVPNKICLTIEGNASKDKNSNGGEVVIKIRFIETIECFINPLGL